MLQKSAAELGKCDFKCNQRSTLFINKMKKKMQKCKKAFYVNKNKTPRKMLSNLMN